MDEKLQWHVTLATRGRQPLVLDDASRLTLLRELVARAGAVLVLFAIVDDHIHLWLLGPGDALATALRSITFALATPMQERHIEVVESRAHARRLVPYLLTQPDHHGLGVPSAGWPGGCVADLLGARTLAGWTPRVSALLPRLRLRDVHAAVRLPVTPLVPCPIDAVAALGCEGLIAAAAATYAADPPLLGKEAHVVRAVEAAASLARQAGLPMGRLAELLGRTREATSRAASRATSVEALRKRITLDNWVAALPKA